MLVNWLVTAIINTDAIKSQINTVSACDVMYDDTPQVPQVQDTSVFTPMGHPIAVPLAAVATVAAAPTVATVVAAPTVSAAAASTTTLILCVVEVLECLLEEEAEAVLLMECLLPPSELLLLLMPDLVINVAGMKEK